MQNFTDYQQNYQEDLTLNFKKLFFILWSRKFTMFKIGFIVFAIVVLSTFVFSKKYKVVTDLYINKTNNSNMAEINPYFIDEMGSVTLNSVSDKTMMNELEFIQSPLVMDKVIVDNNIRFEKFLGIFPTVKTGKYMTTEKFLKYNRLKIEHKKGTSVIEISYKDKDRELAYNIINSIIKYYVELHKEINNEKSKSDKKILEAEYNQAKQNLNSKITKVSGLPINAMNSTGNLAAMSAFSKSAQQAMANIKGQFVEGEKSQIELREESEKVTQLASKLQWAKLVDEMSDSSKVFVLKEPRLPEEYEQVSPKILINIILGIVYGVFFALFSVIFKEYTDKELTYSMLGENIIYNLDKEFKTLATEVISNENNKMAFIFFEEMPKSIFEKFKNFVNVIPLKAEISNTFKDSLNNVNNIVTFASIGKTSSEDYKLVKKMVTNLNKEIIYEVLV